MPRNMATITNLFLIVYSIAASASECIGHLLAFWHSGSASKQIACAADRRAGRAAAMEAAAGGCVPDGDVDDGTAVMRRAMIPLQ